MKNTMILVYAMVIMTVYPFRLNVDNSELLHINYSNLVSRADITYEKPAPRSEAGLPVGNGHAPAYDVSIAGSTGVIGQRSLSLPTCAG